MKQKELNKTFYDDFKLKKPFDLRGLYKNISALLMVNVGLLCRSKGSHVWLNSKDRGVKFDVALTLWYGAF